MSASSSDAVPRNTGTRDTGTGDRRVIQIGPFHPLLEEPVGFELTVEGETVVDVDARMDYIHKGIERLAQERTYDMVPILLERICGICSVTHSVCFCNASCQLR